MTLPVLRELPPGLNHRTGLRREGLVPTGPVVARYEYRTRKGWLTCDLYDAAHVRAIDPARVARGIQAHHTRRENRRQADLRALEQDEADALTTCQADFRAAVQQFARWFATPDLLILDTETTGLEGQVIELAVATVAGDVLLNTQVQPTIPVEEDARAVHGLTDRQLAKAPTWPTVAARLHAVVGERLLLAYDAGFDRMRIAQTARAHGVVSPLEDPRRWRDAMTTYAPLNWQLRRNQEWRWTSLADACLQQGVAPEPRLHRAVGGALALARLVTAIAARLPEPPDTLPDGIHVQDD